MHFGNISLNEALSFSFSYEENLKMLNGKLILLNVEENEQSLLKISTLILDKTVQFPYFGQ